MTAHAAVRTPPPDRTCVEARGLARGLRRAWRLRLPRQALRTWHRAMSSMKLHLAASKQTFALVEGGFMVPDRAGVHLVVISPDVELARQCLAVELSNVGRAASETWEQLNATIRVHRMLGQAYGYPSCCVEAFCDAHVDAVLLGDAGGDNGLAIARAVARSEHFHPWLAALPGAFGVATKSTLRHLPCRFDCRASVAIAEALLDDLQALDRRRHALLSAGQQRALWLHADGRVTANAPADVHPDDAAPAALWSGQRLPIELPFGASG